MERIHEIQGALRIHSGPQRDRGRTFGDADFHQTFAPSSILLQCLMFCRGVLRNRRSQSGPPEERVLHQTRRPYHRLVGACVNLGKSNPWRSQFVSGSSLNIWNSTYGATCGLAAASTVGSAVSFPGPPAESSGLMPMAR